jgi:hypothetical protein
MPSEIGVAVRSIQSHDLTFEDRGATQRAAAIRDEVEDYQDTKEAETCGAQRC